jgi:hypothetical protein
MSQTQRSAQNIINSQLNIRNIKVFLKSAEVLAQKTEAKDTRQQRKAVHIHKPAAILVQFRCLRLM